MRLKAKLVGIVGGIALLAGGLFLLGSQPDYPFVDGCYAVNDSRFDSLPPSARSVQHYVCYEPYDDVSRRVETYAKGRGSVGITSGTYFVSRTRSSSGATNLIADMTVDVRLDSTGHSGNTDRVSVTVWDYGDNWVTRLRRAFRLK